MINPASFSVAEAEEIKKLRDEFFEFICLSTVMAAAEANEIKKEMAKLGVPTISEANMLVNYYGI